jgi:serine/threonine-protein kinase
MDLDPAEIARTLPFEERYELRQKRWYDGPHESWEAFDRVLEREVVVNRPWLYTKIPRFIRAAKIAASFQHPGFPPVYDLGILGDLTPFYTTAPVRGESLSVLLRKSEGEGAPTAKPFPLRPIVEAVRDACRALEYAHGRGFLHLDLHPECLLIGKDRHVILGADEWREMGDGLGDGVGIRCVAVRPGFMSPEQLDETGRGLGPATDVLGVGGILHVILFGTPPNHLPGRANAAGLIRAVAERAFEPRRPGMLRPGIRASEGRRRIDRLVGICLKALAYEPERRYPTAAPLGAALDEWLEPDRSSWWEAIRRRDGGV